MNAKTRKKHEKAIITLKNISNTLSKLTSESENETTQETETITVPYKLKHWRTLPENISSTYQMLYDGTNLINSTSTRYTLITKISNNSDNNEDDSNISLLEDLLKGSQYISSSILLFHANELGCVTTLRNYIKSCTINVISNVILLIESFVNATANDTTFEQKTGAIWEACTKLLKVPKGNRNCIRRDILQYICEINDTYAEFHDIVQLGPLQEEQQTQQDDENDWDDFCEGMVEDQYTTNEIEIVKPCLQLIQYTKGTLMHALKVMDYVGTKISSEDDENNNEIHNFIKELHQLCITLGNGITDYGVLLYPPLDIDIDTTKEDDNDSLVCQSMIQQDRIITLNKYILNFNHGSNVDSTMMVSEELRNYSHKIINTTTRQYKIINGRFET